MIHRRPVQTGSGGYNKWPATELGVILRNWIWSRGGSREDLHLGYLLQDPEGLQVPREFLLALR